MMDIISGIIIFKKLIERNSENVKKFREKFSENRFKENLTLSP